MDEQRATTSNDNDATLDDEPVLSKCSNKTKLTAGVIYLSRIPNKMNVTIIRSYFDQYGQTGRIFLQLSSTFLSCHWLDQNTFVSIDNENKSKRERGPKYTEGWIEFKSKRQAKLIAKQLNNQQVGGRRRTPWYDDIWNIKSVVFVHSIDC
jgi:ESF2/ABP1 family protein